jgi:hypothetical protein
VFEFDLTGVPGAGGYSRVRVPVPLEIGLQDLSLIVTARRSPGARGPDVVVTAEVVNSGQAPLTLDLVAVAPGVARSKASIGTLSPGSHAARLFAFPGGASLRGQRVTVSVYDAENKARLNKSVVIE